MYQSLAVVYKERENRLLDNSKKKRKFVDSLSTVIMHKLFLAFFVSQLTIEMALCSSGSNWFWQRTTKIGISLRDDNDNEKWLGIKNGEIVFGDDEFKFSAYASSSSDEEFYPKHGHSCIGVNSTGSLAIFNGTAACKKHAKFWSKEEDLTLLLATDAKGTNWIPGMPNRNVQSYDLGKNSTRIETFLGAVKDSVICLFDEKVMEMVESAQTNPRFHWAFLE